MDFYYSISPTSIFFLFFEAGFLCANFICPAINSVYQFYFEITEISLPLSLSAEIKGHHTQLLFFIIFSLSESVFIVNLYLFLAMNLYLVNKIGQMKAIDVLLAVYPRWLGVLLLPELRAVLTVLVYTAIQ